MKSKPEDRLERYKLTLGDVRKSDQQRDELLGALKACDDAFVSWQVGNVPGRPEDILRLIVKVRTAIANAEGGKP